MLHYGGRAFVFWCVFLLGGCAAGTDTTQSEPIHSTSTAVPPENPGVMRFATDAPTSTRVFLEALDALYRSDPSLQAAKLRGTALESRGLSQANPVRPEISLTGRTLGDDSLRLQISQPLIDFGKRRAEVARLAAEQGKTELALALARAALLANTFDAVETAHYAQERIALHRKQIADYAEGVLAARRLMDLNLATSAELRLAEVEKQRAEIGLARARQDLADAQLSWTHLFGERNIVSSLDPVLLRRAVGIATEKEAIRLGLVSSLALRSLAAENAVLDAQSDVIKSKRSPTIAAVAGIALAGDDKDDRFGVGLTLEVPIYRRDRQDEAAQNASDIAALAAEMVATRRELEIEIRRAGARAAAARDLAVLQSSSIGLLEERVSDVERQVQTGLVPYTKVIEARGDVFDATFNIIASRHEARLFEAEIILLTGILIP